MFLQMSFYSKEVGKQIKTNEILGNDHTENGWYIKNGGLTNLPDSIRNRLFNIGVANAVKEETKEDLEKIKRLVNTIGKDMNADEYKVTSEYYGFNMQEIKIRLWWD